MLDPVPAEPVDKALDAIDGDVLPALSTLLRSISDKAASGTPSSYDDRSAELRDMNRQIIALTRFLAAVTADAAGQAAEARIRA